MSNANLILLTNLAKQFTTGVRSRWYVQWAFTIVYKLSAHILTLEWQRLAPIFLFVLLRNGKILNLRNQLHGVFQTKETSHRVASNNGKQFNRISAQMHISQCECTVDIRTLDKARIRMENTFLSLGLSINWKDDDSGCEIKYNVWTKGDGIRILVLCEQADRWTTKWQSAIFGHNASGSRET